MDQHLLLAVRFHGDGRGTARFHGVAQGAPEWPPAPARLFQALVSGVARGNTLPAALVPALEWLEALPPPVIAAPQRVLGQEVAIYVPNNDADSLTDPTDPSSIRTPKSVVPSLFPADSPLLYAWPIQSSETERAEAVTSAALELYQLGRGIDPAWAVGQLVEEHELLAELARYEGMVLRPLSRGGGHLLACPVSGSLKSLTERHRAVKLRSEGSGKKARVLFTNPPKPVFLQTSYARAEHRAVYELRTPVTDKPWPWSLTKVVGLVEWLRDEAASRLRAGLPGRADAVESTLVGRKVDSPDAARIEDRVRIVPLPSIGSDHADHAIRRVLLEVPTGGPLRREDLEWAFSGLVRADRETGEVQLVITRTDAADMLRHYRGPSLRWRSVTPVVLPQRAQRRRIDPSRQSQEAKDATERRTEEDRAVAAVHVALRHAGVLATAVQVRVQREPFEGKGGRAEAFAESTRFAKERLWHVELEFNRQLDGPLVIGDGRFLGLGVLAPVPKVWASEDSTTPGRKRIEDSTGIVAFGATGVANDDPLLIARALRRAVMARVQRTLGQRALPSFFTGHDDEGNRLTSESPAHLSFQWDSAGQRLLVMAPHRLASRHATWEEGRHLEKLEQALDGFTELRAGSAGYLQVHRLAISEEDLLLRSGRCWVTLSPYTATRHRKGLSAREALKLDVLDECQRRGLPRPDVNVLDAWGAPGRGLEGMIRLDFSVSVSGPLVLGRTRQLGGGLFANAAGEREAQI